MSVHKYSVTPDSNTSVGDGSDAVGLQEGMPRQNVNNAMRAIASDIAKNYKDHGSLVTAGTGTAYTVFAQSDFTTYFVGLSLVVKLHANCGANATINVNGRGAKQLRMRDPNGTANVEANALRANEVVHIVYNGTQFHVLGAFDFASIHSRISTLETQAASGTVNNSDKLDGQHGSYYQNASNLNSGTVAIARLPVGSGNNLDADKLDGLHASHFLAASSYNAADVKNKLLTVDGAGSNIDADLLDGQHGSFYRNASNLNSGSIPSARLSGTYSISISGSAAQVGGIPASNIMSNNGDTYVVQDTRSVNTPTDLGSRGVKFEFKYNSTDGLNDGGAYHGALTFQQWQDSSGGYTHQIGMTGNGNLFNRTAVVGGSWGAWKRLVNMTDIQSYNAVGSYIFANNNSGGTVSPNATVAGSSLRPTSAGNSSATGSALSGTWRCMGYKTGGNTSWSGTYESTLWVRIA